MKVIELTKQEALSLLTAQLELKRTALAMNEAKGFRDALAQKVAVTHGVNGDKYSLDFEKGQILIEEEESGVKNQDLGDGNTDQR